MDNGALLFYSCNGYALYNASGAVLDSHSVIKDNKKLAGNDPRRWVLAYPIDPKTLLYYRRNRENNDSIEVYEKKLYKKSMGRIDNGTYACIRDIETARVFNLANNVVLDELAPKSFIKPNLVGYTSLASGTKWWSLDRFYSFLSPIIVMQEGSYCAFFPGLLSDQKTEIKKHLIAPLGAFSKDDRWYYYGVHSTVGSTTPESHQILFFCDHAGNLLSTSQLLKQITIDAVLEYDKKRNTNYTVKRPWQFVFMPAIDGNGDAYYGMIDFKAATIEVNKRLFYRYKAHIIEPTPTSDEAINEQRKFIILPGTLKFQNTTVEGYSETAYLVRNEVGKHRRATIKDIASKGFNVTVQRAANPELKKKLSQGTGTLPSIVKHVRDSLAKLPNTQRPCTMTLCYNESEKIRVFYFSPGEELVAARIIGVTDKREIFVRIDMKDRAEVIVFAQDGNFLNRFTFNRQALKARKDLIGIMEDGTVVEEDYERIKEDYTYFKWELTTSRVENYLFANGHKDSRS